MKTFKVFSDLEKSIIKILSGTDVFYRFEYIEWCNRTYLHIDGHLSKDIEEKLQSLSY